MPKAEIVTRLAEACMGWSYVWGGYGQQCTPANRKSYADRDTCPSGETSLIYKRCQVLNDAKSSCDGCKWYPGGRTLFFDCRGFTRWCFSKVGISIQGAGATSQWNTAANWAAKGTMDDLPENVCCVFMRQGNTMSHTGIYLGNGLIIHCSGEVKKGKPTDKGWTNWAIPKGMEGGIVVWRPTVRKGSTGDDVKYVQERLIELGYDIAPYGADGKFGNKTLAAVKAFQKANGLTADGVVGPLTYEKLELAKPEPDAPLYTVSIYHLTKAQADALKKQYTDAEIKEELG